MNREKHEIKLAGVWALNLLGQESPEKWRYLDAMRQFKKAAEICRRRIEKLKKDSEEVTK